MKIGGLVLALVGAVVLIWGAFGFRTREKVIDIGPIEASRETTHYTPYAPIAGAVLMIGGVVLMVAGRKT
jgi:drug/metabolite transporter (DMT)-like permease